MTDPRTEHLWSNFARIAKLWGGGPDEYKATRRARGYRWRTVEGLPQDAELLKGNSVIASFEWRDSKRQGALLSTETKQYLISREGLLGRRIDVFSGDSLGSVATSRSISESRRTLHLTESGDRYPWRRGPRTGWWWWTTPEREGVISFREPTVVIEGRERWEMWVEAASQDAGEVLWLLAGVGWFILNGPPLGFPHWPKILGGRLRG